MNNTVTPADLLEGITLPNGWEITEKQKRATSSTGGNFGIGYIAKRAGQTAFLKAIDFRSAFQDANFIEKLNSLTSYVLWEKEVLAFCKDKSMSRIVRLIDYQDIVLPQDGDDQTKKVCCFLFEVGEGDLRGNFHPVSSKHSWRLRVLRDVALGLDQLHRRGVAHLDVKPSNVIVVDSNPTDGLSKLGDLARSVRRGVNGPFDAMNWPGDWSYAPPEKWYSFRAAQWRDEREAADLYLLGSIFVYLYTGIPLNPLLIGELPEPFRPGTYKGNFDQNLIDVLKQAQVRTLALRVFPELPATNRDELESMLLEMTAPHPEERGDKLGQRQGNVGLDRYHQKLYRIYKRNEFAERAQK